MRYLLLLLLLFYWLPPGSAYAQQEPIRFTEPWAAPEFTHNDIEGNVHKLSDYAGSGLIINFWATWCPPCVSEMPSLQRLAEQVAGAGIRILGINLGEDAETAEAFARRYEISFPLLLDESMSSQAAWPLKGLPTTYLINATGQVVATVIGEREWDDPALIEQIKTLGPE